MGAFASSTAPPEFYQNTEADRETQIFHNIQLNQPHSDVMSLVKQIQRYDSCGIGYSRIKSENYSIAEHIWEQCTPYELAHLACTHPLPQVRIYAFEGLSVLLRTMKNYGHSPYWRFRFQPTECNVEELEDILCCTLIQLQCDQTIATSMSGANLNQCRVSSAVKKLGWDLLLPDRQLKLENIILQSNPESNEAEEILRSRSETTPTLETYLLLERQLNKKPHLLQQIAKFEKLRDLSL